MSEISEKSYIFIKHINDDNTWKITRESALHSELLKETIIDNPNSDTYGIIETNPFIINIIKINTIKFAVDYMEFYSGIVEKVPPEYPLKNIHISILLDGEYHLFNNIYLENDDVKTKIIKLNDCIETATYFAIKNLPKKICAIIAFILKDLSITDIKKLSE